VNRVLDDDTHWRHVANTVEKLCRGAGCNWVCHKSWWWVDLIPNLLMYIQNGHKGIPKRPHSGRSLVIHHHHHRYFKREM